MRQCQRKAQNLPFYLHKYKAEKIIDDYEDWYPKLADSLQRQYMVAYSRYSIVLSDYLLQIGDRREAIRVMDRLGSSNTLNLNADTLLWLNYLSHQGAVRYIPVDIRRNKRDIEKGYDCLMQCYILSSRNNIPLYQAVSMQLLSQYLSIDSIYDIVRHFDNASLRYINEDNVPDNLLAGNMAERALYIFLSQRDAYLTVKAWSNLAMCYFNIGNAERSIECLNNALAMPQLDSIPDLKATVSEQMSMAYSALDNKYLSDIYRNQYLDLQDSTRQDRQLEARAIELQGMTHKIWIWVAAAFAVFLLLVLFTFVLVRLRKRNQRRTTAVEEDIELLQEDIDIAKQQYTNNIRSQEVLRAQISVINGMMPLIERIRSAVDHGEKEYALEVAQDIDQQNALLTKWIKLQQGTVKPKVENVALNDIFKVVRKASKDTQITIEDTTATVKADRTLTLFILNTLIENARKATAETVGGGITLTCRENNAEKYAEISVTDNGKGMTQEQLDHLFEVKPIKDELQEGSEGHGFGLQNCRGIIDRYRKISSIFAVCQITAQSRVGEGTTISFRLPLVLKMLVLLVTMTTTLTATAKSDIERFADSLYIYNVNGNYSKAMEYSDSCIALKKEGSKSVLLSVYNETAVAALALHDWERYKYYNYLYTNLYKDYTSDTSLPAYIQKMQRSEMVGNISMVVVIILLIALLPVFWFIYLRPLIRYRRGLRLTKEQRQGELKQWNHQNSRQHLINNIMSNQLSMVKHETMYYPSRIMQMLQDEDEDIATATTYYSKLYSLLSNNMIGEQVTRSLCTIHNMQWYGADIMGNDDLLEFLVFLMKRHNGGIEPTAEVSDDGGRYVNAMFTMDQADFVERDIDSLFTVNTIHTDYLVMRQILRDIGNGSLAYGTGINAIYADGKGRINVILPKKTSGKTQ